MTDEPCPLCGYAAGHSATCSNLPSNREKGGLNVARQTIASYANRVHPAVITTRPVNEPIPRPPKSATKPFTPFRYPHGAEIILRWDAEREQWTGTLTAVLPGGQRETFQANAKSYAGAGSKLAEMWRKFPKDKDDGKQTPNNSPEDSA